MSEKNESLQKIFRYFSPANSNIFEAQKLWFSRSSDFNDIFEVFPPRRLCRKRSVFSDEQLKGHWNYYPGLKPFVVNFLFAHPLPKRPNFAQLKQHNIITEAPRGFEEISNAKMRFVVD